MQWSTKTAVRIASRLSQGITRYHKVSAHHVVYLDYSNCFDKVCHTKLFHKLSKYGITDFALSWLENFLTNRVQSVKVNSCLSPPNSSIIWSPTRHSFRTIVTFMLLCRSLMLFRIVQLVLCLQIILNY